MYNFLFIFKKNLRDLINKSTTYQKCFTNIMTKDDVTIDEFTSLIYDPNFSLFSLKLFVLN